MVTIMGLRDFIIIGICGAAVVTILLVDISFFNINRKAADRPKHTGAEELEKSLDIKASTLITKCEAVIKPQLNKPESFKIDTRQTRVYKHDNKLVLDMLYYAENSYGISMAKKASCDFSQTGILISTTNEP